MDINEVKKFIQNKIASDNLTQKVRDTIKIKKWEKQDLKEGFKESLKPLIKAQNNISDTIKKENDETIEQLEKNQLALTRGLLANRLALEQGLQAMKVIMPAEEEFEDAQPVTPEPGPSTAEPPPKPSPKSGPLINLETEMDEYGINLLEEYGFVRPRDFLQTEPDTLNEILKNTTKSIRSLNGEINGYKNRKNKTLNDEIKLGKKKNELNTLRNYKTVLSTYLNSLKYQTGKGIYFQNPHQLLNRLELLTGSILAGNNGVIPEFSQLAHFLNKNNIITKKQLNDLLKTYINIK